MVRILKPGGRAIVAFLNSWGLMRTGVVDFPERFRDAAFLRDMLGDKTFAGRELSGFTECHWSNPAIARKELRSVGLRIVSYAGVESFLSGMGPLLEPLSRCESGVYDNLVEVAAETAELPQFRDATDHLHFVVER